MHLPYPTPHYPTSHHPVSHYSSSTTPTVALLVDAENIGSDYLDFIISRAEKYGTLRIRRAYADWTMLNIANYRNVIKRHAITTIQQFTQSSGKNSSDMSLSIDAMDLFFHYNIQTFVLATSDSDFTPLAIKLRELGACVIGVGNPNTSQSLIYACHDFHYIPIAQKPPTPKARSTSHTRPTPKPTQEKPTPTRTTPVTPLQTWQQDPNKDPQIINIINHLLDTKSDGKGYVSIAMVGTALNQANIYSTNYGFEKTKAMLNCMNDFEVFTIDDTAFIQKRVVVATPEPYDSDSLTSDDLASNAEQQYTTFVNAIAHGIAQHQLDFGWAPIGKVIVFVRQQFGMEAKDYGYATMNEAFDNLSTIFETTTVDSYHYVRDTRTTPSEWANNLPTPPQKSQEASPTNQNEPTKPQTTKPIKEQPSKSPKKLNAENRAKLKTLLTKAMTDNSQEAEDNWFSLTTLSGYLRQYNIDPKAFGHKNFVYLMQEFGELKHKMIGNHHYYKDPAFVALPAAKQDKPSDNASSDVAYLPNDTNKTQYSNKPESVESVENQAPSDNDSELAKLLTIIDEAIATYANGEGLTKIGDIGKFVRKTTGLGSQSFGYADFGKLLDMLPNYQVIRQGRYIYAKKA